MKKLWATGSGIQMWSVRLVIMRFRKLDAHHYIAFCENMHNKKNNLKYKNVLLLFHSLKYKNTLFYEDY